jgi:hypothetical protein
VLHDTNNAPILTVPQLYIWRLGNCLVSAFPSTERDYPTDHIPGRIKGSLHAIRAYKGAGTIGEYMTCIILKHVEAFGGDSDFGKEVFSPALDIFETAVASTLLAVDEYIKGQTKATVDIEQEGKFIHEISDIRDELAMIQEVLNQQEKVLSGLLNNSNAVFTKVHTSQSTDASQQKGEETGQFDSDSKENARQAIELIKGYFERTEKIDRDAQRVAQVIQDKLNLKRTAANMEASAASLKAANAGIEEARQSKLLSFIVLGFTIVTLIFTPISFLAALFALDIDTFSGIKYSPAPTSTSTPTPTPTPGDGNKAYNDSENQEVYDGRILAGISGKPLVLPVVK